MSILPQKFNHFSRQTGKSRSCIVLISDGSSALLTLLHESISLADILKLGKGVVLTAFFTAS
ncbi:MAG: hypothetical protein AB9907_14895 [Flexilinea sp.]